MNYLQQYAEMLDGPKRGYAWIITTDHLAVEFGEVGSDEDDTGTVGPRTATEEDIARLNKGEGDTFKMYDDDGELYYTGRLVVSGDLTYDDEEACAGPLEDFGMPNAGAVSIKWSGHPEREIS